MRRLSETHKGKLQFFLIYIDEAHPADGWSLSVNKEDGVCIRRPKTQKERIDAVKLVAKTSAPGYPIFVDLMDNNANELFAAWPERIYVILDGKVAFKGGPGPFGYDIDALEAWITNHELKTKG